MTIRETLFEYIPKKYFVEKLSENSIGHIKLAFVRETVNPLIIRSTDSESTIILVSVDGRELVEIPPRKFKSREKLLGLMICREFGVVNEGVRYNSIFESSHLNNPNSLLFGDSVTQSNDAAALPSRAIYDWAYSLRDVKDITDKLQHNAISEDGTILKDKDFNPKQEDGTKVASQALHQTEYVLPGTYFPHFITVDNITPELFIHLLSCVLNQRRYGAQTTTTANNVNNHLVAIGFSSFEKPINSYTISKAWNQESEDKKKIGQLIDYPTLDLVKKFVQAQMQLQYSKSGLISSDTSKNVDSFGEWFNQMWDEFDSTQNGKNETSSTEPQDKETLSQIYKTAQSSVDEYLREIRMVSDKPSGKTGSAAKSRVKKPQQQNQAPEVENKNEDPTNKN